MPPRCDQPELPADWRAALRVPGGATAAAGVVVRGLASAFVAAACVGFALANGLEYGTGNQWQYLLHGLHAADPAFLHADWFTTQTVAHHALFNLLVELAAATGRPDVVLGLLNGAASVAFASCLYLCAARFSPRPLLPFVAALALAAHLGPDGPGHSNILLPCFVPSVLSGVALLASLTCVLYGASLAAGLIAAVGCAFHANYLVLVGPLWLLVLVLDRSSPRGRRAAHLLIPWALAWLAHVPYFAALWSDPTPVEASRRIFWNVYAPQHYRPATWAWRPLADYGLVLCAGGLAWVWVLGRPRWPRRPAGTDPAPQTARAIVAGLAILVAGGAAFSALLPMDFVTALYPWRLAPFLALAAFLAIGLALDPAAGAVGSWRAAAWRRAVCTGLAVAAVLATRMPWSSAGWLAAAGLSAWASARLAARSRTAGAGLWGELPAIATLALLAAGLVRTGLWRGEPFVGRDRPSARSLFDWCRQHAPHDAVFVIPPELAAFRLEAARAAVVDWKCMPLLPRDQLEWWRRQVLQAGEPVGSLAEANAAYAGLGASRAAGLAEAFAARYVVTDRRWHAAEMSGLHRVFRNDGYEVWEIPPARRRSGGFGPRSPSQPPGF